MAGVYRNRQVLKTDMHLWQRSRVNVPAAFYTGSTVKVNACRAIIDARAWRTPRARLVPAVRRGNREEHHRTAGP